MLVYANVQTGYIPFGYGYFPSTSTQSNYTPESRLLGFSAGFKSRFLDNRLEINSEGYYYDYQNFQALNFNGVTGLSTDVPAQRSTIYGDELTLRILLPDSVEFDTGMNFMSAHYDRFTGPGYDYSGNQMIDSPVANVNAGLQKEAPFLQFGSLRGRVQTHYESGHWGIYANAPDTHQSAYTKTDLTVTFRPNVAPWSLEAYVDNVENQPVYGAIALGGQPGPATGFLEPPRTYGLRFRSSW